MPKGVMLTHENVNYPAHNVAFCERTTEKDRALCALPLHHVFAVVHIMTSTIMSGACLEILPGFDMETVLSVIEVGQITKILCSSNSIYPFRYFSIVLSISCAILVIVFAQARLSQ